MSDKNAPISPENKKIAHYVASAFGGTPRVVEYINDSDTLSVGILSCSDRPVKGVTSYATIKLSDHRMNWKDGEFPARLELVGMCLSTAEFFANILSSAAFTIMQSDKVYRSGTAIPYVVEQHYPESKLPHLYLTEPFIWKHDLKKFDCGTKNVTWLLVLPISHAEYLYLTEHGKHALESVLQKENADFSNLGRMSVV
jgi:hypothetical protein